MYAAIYFFHLDRQNIPADFLRKAPRDPEWTKIPLFPEPEPCAESIVSGAEDFRAAGSERTQFPICARALQDERRLSLIKFSGDPPHLLAAQPVRVLHHCERVAPQWLVGKHIDETRNEFGHFHLLLFP